MSQSYSCATFLFLPMSVPMVTAWSRLFTATNGCSVLGFQPVASWMKPPFVARFAVPAFVNDGQRQPVELYARLGIDRPVIMRQKVFANLWDMRMLEWHGHEDVVRGAAHKPVNRDEVSLSLVSMLTHP